MPDPATIGSSGASGAETRAPAAGASRIRVRVWLFGLIARMAGERDVSLDLPLGAKVADVLAALCQRYGETFAHDLMRTRKEKSSACRISVNGRLVHDLETRLADENTTVEIIVLSAYEGG